MNVGEVRVGLNDVEQSIQSHRSALHVFPSSREFERRFSAGIEHRSDSAACVDDRISRRRIGKNKIGNERIAVCWQSGVPEVARLVIVSSTEANPWHD